MMRTPPFSGGDIETALAAGEFFLHYQPRFDLNWQRIVGAEALVRWDRPGVGIVPPLDFIHVAERELLIERLGAAILDQACAAAARWRNLGFDLEISVNVSPLQLTREFPRLLAGVLARHQLPPAYLELEITEGVLVSDPMLRIVNDIISMGVGIAIDDFGTGHSSLAYLRRLRARSLKIDRSFLSGVPGDLDGCLVLNTITKLGHGLGMVVVCEGVEGGEQMELIRLTGADQIQGFFIAPALSVEEIEGRLLGEREPIRAHG